MARFITVIQYTIPKMYVLNSTNAYKVHGKLNKVRVTEKY